MEIIYYIANVVTLLVMLVGAFGIMKPHLFSRPLKRFATRKWIFAGTFVLLLLLFTTIGATTPQHIKDERAKKQQNNRLQQ